MSGVAGEIDLRDVGHVADTGGTGDFGCVGFVSTAVQECSAWNLIDWAEF